MAKFVDAGSLVALALLLIGMYLWQGLGAAMAVAGALLLSYCVYAAKGA